MAARCGGPPPFGPFGLGIPAFHLSRGWRTIEVIAGAPGWPDMVFPANAAVVLDGRALLGPLPPIRAPGRRKASPARPSNACSGGACCVRLPSFRRPRHEGAGDAIWDATRQLFWTGFGQRSDKAAANAIARFFGHDAVAFGAGHPALYHLDTCSAP